MARLPRLVLPGYPYHVTQRGNRRQQTFFEDDDYAAFLGRLEVDADRWQALRRAETTGRPLGAAYWIATIEARTGRTLAPKKRGPKLTAKPSTAGAEFSVFGKLSP